MFKFLIIFINNVYFFFPLFFLPQYLHLNKFFNFHAKNNFVYRKLHLIHNVRMFNLQVFHKYLILLKAIKFIYFRF